MKKLCASVFVLLGIWIFNSVPALAQDSKLKISLQKIIPSGDDPGAFIRVNEIQEWNPSETAIIICDMWDQHWCKGATDRVAEMAPVMNRLISTARDKGILIVHAPSDCMDYYKNHPARHLAKKYINKKLAGLISDKKLDSEKDAAWPVDQSDGGCDCSPECKQGNPWSHQTDLIKISEKDAISDSGAEIAGLFTEKGIKNVILMGVHTNMCVIGRSFGLRNMIRMGFNVALMRDMTDTMYDSRQWPKVSHFTGNSLVCEYIEKYVCPTLVSTDLTGQKQFRFRDDKRPVVAFVIAENEYHANRRLPEFGHELLMMKGVNCEYALGKPVYTGEGIHNIENLQILKDADLVVIQVRRRALPSESMALLKEYVASGKPVIGIRTASHAFSASQAVPNPAGGLSSGSGKAAEFLDQWPDFDPEVLGGNYHGHYGTMKEPIIFSVVPGMENHPLLKGVAPGDFAGPVVPLYTLYENRPLRSPDIQVLLTGKIPDKPSEPVLWINNRNNGKVIYTSMGHWLDWDIPQFRQIMSNAVDFLLNLNKK